MRRTYPLVLAALVAAFTLATTTEAATKRRTDFPCAGCLTDLPEPLAPQTKAPLLVLLHGDGQGPLAVAPLFAKEAAARGIVLFVPQCPKADGCTDARWWSWNHDPAWFDAPIAAIDAVQPLDHDRLWLSGWSGGGSYIGRVAPALAGRFAAVSINGGGMSPNMSTCPSTCALPAYFMVGDKNPYHSLAIDLRDWFDGCKQDVVWDLQKGKDHGGELLELSKPAKVATILTWLEQHPRTCPTPVSVPVPAPVSIPVPPTAPPTATATTATTTTTATTSPAQPLPSTTPPGRCGCNVSRDDSSIAFLSSAVFVVAAFARRRVRASVARRG